LFGRTVKAMFRLAVALSPEGAAFEPAPEQSGAVFFECDSCHASAPALDGGTMSPVLRPHDILMNGEGLSEGKRAAIFAHVSGFKACSFCTRGHVTDQVSPDLSGKAVPR
jgi:hypothetical protein